MLFFGDPHVDRLQHLQVVNNYNGFAAGAARMFYDHLAELVYIKVKVTFFNGYIFCRLIFVGVKGQFKEILDVDILSAVVYLKHAACSQIPGTALLKNNPGQAAAGYLVVAHLEAEVKHRKATLNDVLFDASLCGVIPYKEHKFALGTQTDVSARTTAFSR